MTSDQTRCSAPTVPSLANHQWVRPVVVCSRWGKSMTKGCQRIRTVPSVVQGMVHPVASRSKTTAASAALPM